MNILGKKLLFTVIAIIILLLYIILYNINSKENFGSGPTIFLPENYGEHGMYYDNINLEPEYEDFLMPTFYDK